MMPSANSSLCQGLFGEGRVSTLREQLVGPVNNPMKFNHALLALLQAGFDFF